jgi:glycerol-3-phosphate dehydrogenase (NAD(P)+)
MTHKENIGVIGAGAWGTALAHLIAQAGHHVTLWAREPEVAESINTQHENITFLKGSPLNPQLIATDSLEEACRDKKIILFVVPSQHTRTLLSSVLPYLAPHTIPLCASKGIEITTLKLLSEVFAEILPAPIGSRTCFISGPSFAREVVENRPTAITLASNNVDVAKEVQRILSVPFFKLYTSSDVVGVEVGGAFKNVIAIAAGVVEGLNLGHSTMAAMITRGIHEMSRLGIKLGANPLTFSGLSGIGDLVLTCTGGLSRNRSLGIEIAQGKKVDTILKKRKTVAEGYYTAKAVHNLTQKLGLELPIAQEVYKILYEGKSPTDTLHDLTSRDLKDELEGIV